MSAAAKVTAGREEGRRGVVSRPLDLDGRPVAPGLYWWVRELDETGMSGAGRVAQVAVFEDGSAVLRWLASRNSAGVGSSVFYDRLSDLIYVHGHGEKRTGRLAPIDAEVTQ